MKEYPFWLRTLLVCSVAGGLTLVYFFKPQNYPYPTCVFHDLTGLYCTGCGCTRALYQLLHGHWGTALHDNALSVFAIPFLAYASIRKEPLSTLHPFWVWGIFYLVVTFSILRNIPLYPFTYLAPLQG